jgi:hypothetical protein
MRSIIEQVAEFIESYFNGTFVSGLSDTYVRRGANPRDTFIDQRINLGPETITIGDSTINVGFLLKQLVEKLIPDYLKAQDAEKEKIAGTIFQAIIQLRTFGMIRNNPFSFKELDFYKAQVKTLTQLVESVKKQRDEFLRILDENKLPPEKKGFTAVG